MPSIRTASALLKHGLIKDEDFQGINEVANRYSIAITPVIQDRIIHVNDPVAKQFIPSTSELITHPDELMDPIGDTPFTPVKGITHRYPDRVLLKITHMLKWTHQSRHFAG